MTIIQALKLLEGHNKCRIDNMVNPKKLGEAIDIVVFTFGCVFDKEKAKFYNAFDGTETKIVMNND